MTAFYTQVKQWRVTRYLKYQSLLCLLAVMAMFQPLTLLGQHADHDHEHASSGDIESMLHYFDKQIYFTENRGQFDAQVLYKATFPLGKAIVTKQGVLMSTYDPAAVSERSSQGTRQEQAQKDGLPFNEEPVKVKAHQWMMQFVNASSEVKIEPKQRHMDSFNFFKDGVEATDIASYQEIWYNNVYNKVDVRYYPSAEGSLEYDIVCKPGFKLKDIAINLDGVSNLHLNEKGELVVQTSVGEMILPAPIAYQKINGKVVDIESHYVIDRNDHITFDLGKFDPNHTVVIDPIALRWATWINTNSSAFGTGTSGDNHGHGIWVDETDGAIYIVARVDGQTDQISSGALEDTPNGGIDLIVGKYFEPTTVGGTGVRVWQTYIGGSSDDNPYAIEQGPDGNLYITGVTTSANFPLIGGTAFGNTGGLDGRTSSNDGTFVLKINQAGNSIKSAVIGGNGDEQSFDLRLTSNGDVIVCGQTESTNLATLYPGTGAVNRSNNNNGIDVHVFRISQSLNSIVWMRNYGGTGSDIATIMNLNTANGDLYIAGHTTSSNFPTVNARQSTFTGSRSGFIQKIRSSGTTSWSSYYNSASSKSTRILCMEFNTAKNKLYFGGITSGLDATNMPSNAVTYDNSYNGGSNDFFVALMDTAQVYTRATYLGGSGNEVNMMGLNVDLNDEVYVFGYSNSTNFPTTADALQKNLNNLVSNVSSPDNDKVFVKLPTSLGSAPLYSTYYGGSKDDYDPVGERGIKFSNCRIYTIVTAQSNNIPLTTGALNTTKQSSTSIYEPGLIVWANPPDLENNEIFGNQVLCQGQTPSGLTGSTPNYILANIIRNGTSTAYPATFPSSTVYEWQMSTDSLNWTVIAGGNTKDLPGSLIGELNQKTYFRRIISGDACIIPGAANQTVEVKVLSASVVKENVSCFGANDGSLTANPDGTAPYTYLWSTGANTQTISNLAPGVYTLTVTDAAGCTSTQQHTITQPTLLTASGTPVSSTCQAANGAINLVVSGGTQPYTFSWSNGAVTQNLTGLSANAYDVLVTDANGCTAVATVVVPNISSLTVSSSNVVNVNCFGESTGSFSVNGANGTLPYTYSFENGPFTGQNTFSGLAAGSYSVRVKDNTGCIATVVVNLSEPTQVLSPVTEAINNATCKNSTNGSATINVTGGSAPYSYAWTPSVSSSNSASGLAVGAYSVVVTDNKGCQSSVSFNVEAADAELPTWSTATGSIDAVVLCGDAAALAAAQALVPQATDANTLSYNKVSGAFVSSNNCPTVGTYTNRFIARDLCLNASDEFIQVITVIDTIKPFFTSIPSDITLQCGDEIPSTLAVAEDVCSSAPVTKIDAEVGSDCERVITRTFTATDACGNKAYATQTITVVDSIKPYFTFVPEAVTLQCGDDLPTTEATADDACNSARVTSSDLESGTDCARVITRTFTAEDECGNKEYASQIITIVDTIKPYFTFVPEALTLQCGDDLPTTAATADDACNSARVTSSDIESGTDCERVITRTFTAEDECGNKEYATQIITVVDSIKPYFTFVPEAVTLQCGDDLPTTQATADDACNSAHVTSSDVESGSACERVITRTFTAEDECGNKEYATQIITVVDTIKPYFTYVPEAVTLQCGDDLPNTAATADDACNSAHVTSSDVESGSVCERVITRTFTAEDECGNKEYATQIITVVDTIKPYFTYIPGNTVLQAGQPLPTTMATAADCNEVNVSSSDEESGTDCARIITRTFTARDICGNEEYAEQTITIVDSLQPYFTFIPEDLVLLCNEEVPSTMAVAEDGFGAVNVTRTDSVVGDYCNQTIYRKFVAIDNCDNELEVVQIIQVVDTIKPWFTFVPSDINSQCGIEVPFVNAQADDNCGEGAAVTHVDTVVGEGCNRVITRTFTARDGCGNELNAVQTISIIDTIRPTIYNVPAGLTVSCVADIPAVSTEVYADDNCVGVDLDFVERYSGTACDSTITRIWTALDACGNSTESSQVIKVKDTTAPQFTMVPSGATVACEGDIDFVQPMAADNCGGLVSYTYSDSIIAASSSTTTTDCGQFKSYTIGGWGSPSNSTPGSYLNGNFASAFPNGLVVGCDSAAYTFTSAQAIRNFLPAGGPSSVLTSDATNPTGIQNQLASQLVAATLNVGFDAANTNFASPAGSLGALTYNNGPFAGQTVNQVIAQANQVLGGCATGNLQALSSALTVLNENYDNGNQDDGNFSCGGGNNNNQCEYTIRRRWKATDRCNNSATVFVNYLVKDTIAPVFNNCPETASAKCINELPAVAEGITATDNCGASATVAYLGQQVVAIDACSYTVTRTWSATDACGNRSLCQQTINVSDDVKPTFTFVPENINSQCGIEVPFVNATATDNCGSASVSHLDSVVGEGCNRIITRTFTAIDACGNTEIAIQTISIIDTIRPTIYNVPSGVLVNCLNEVPALPTSVYADDNCTGVQLDYREEYSGNACDSVITRIWIATDACNNSSEASQVIRIYDTVKPTFTSVPADITIGCTDAVPASNATATDNCSAVIVSQSDEVQVNGCVTTVVRTFKATDACGNEKTAEQRIIKRDEVNPVLGQFPAYIHVSCDSLDYVTIPSASDNCGEATVTFVDLLNSGGCLGTIQRTYTAKDACGNTATGTQFISLYDHTGPSINVPDSLVFECNETVIIPTFEAIDNCGEVIEFTHTVDTIPGVCENNLTIVYSFHAVDFCENVTDKNMVIVIRDTTAPAWNDTPEDAVVQCGQEIPAVVMPTASDLCDSDVTVTVSVVEQAGVCANERTIIRTFTATDNCNNSIDFVQQIFVVDTIAPAFGDQTSLYTYTCGQEVPFVQPTATDACGGVTYSHEDGPWMEDACLGYFERTWTAQDACGNTSTFVQTINKVDTELPTISGASALDKLCSDYEGTFVTASDNCDQDVLVTYEDAHVSGGCAGRILRTYTATDDCGNVREFVQIITLIDTIRPHAIGSVENRTVECGSEWSFDNLEFGDNCDDELDITIDFDTTGTACNKVFTKRWIAVDNCNNADTVTQVITVIDSLDPYFTFVPADTTIECGAEIVRLDAVAFDQCAGNVTVNVAEMEIPGSCPSNRQIVRMFRANDNCGHSAMAVQTITIADTQAPTWNIESAPAQLSFECGVIPTGSQPIAEDGCSTFTISVEDTVFVSSTCFTSGAFVYTATDACGNASLPFYQYYTIEDNTAPVVDEFDPAIERPCTDFEGNFITATDACSGVIITYEDQRMSGTCLGHIVRTYHIADSCGNVVDDLYQQIITLTDSERPVPVAMPQDLNLECGAFETIPSFVAEFTDNCDPDGLDITADTVLTDVACGYQILYSWTATDNCGNDTTIYQTITVRDTQNPWFTFVPETMNVSCEEEIEYLVPTASDLCDADVTITEVVDTIAGNCIGSYTIVRRFTAKDDCNLTAIAEQIINVMDEDAPNFTYVPAGGTFSCEQGIPADVATAEDVCGTASVTYSDDTLRTCVNTYRVTRIWYATDDCDNTREAITIYNVVDSIAPTLDQVLPLEPLRVSCLGDVPAPIAVTATDNCGVGTVTPEVFTLESDSCGNGVIQVLYTLRDECGNVAYASYQIVVEDNVDPEFVTQVSDIVLTCEETVPAPASMEAVDNCGNPVRILFEEYTTGGVQMPEGAVSACQLITPSISQATGCQSYYQNKNWAMWLGSIAPAHRYFQVSSGNLFTMADGSLLLQANLVNTSNPSYGGFTVNVKFANGLAWSAWSNQAFPTSFKADCGGVGANHTSWIYYLLQNNPGAELVGYGAYQGSALDLSHAPANKYFGFQLGNGANNLTPGEGMGGWFNYTGTMMFTAPGGNTTTTLLTPNTVSAGDFAFNLDCCPKTVTHRCWTAIDCSQNSTTVCQVIRYAGAGDAVENLHEDPSQIVSDINSAKVVVEVSPNPAVDMTQFSFQAVESGKATIVIYNMAGAVVARVPEMKVEAGMTYRIPYAVNNLAAGLYTIQLNNESSSDITRMMISGK